MPKIIHGKSGRKYIISADGKIMKVYKGKRLRETEHAIGVDSEQRNKIHLRTISIIENRASGIHTYMRLKR